MKRKALFFIGLICLQQIVTPVLAASSEAALARLQLDALARFEQTPEGRAAAIATVSTRQIVGVYKQVFRYPTAFPINYPAFFNGFYQGINNYVTYNPTIVRPVATSPVTVDPNSAVAPSGGSSSNVSSQLISLLQSLLGQNGLIAMLINALISALMSGMQGGGGMMPPGGGGEMPPGGGGEMPPGGGGEMPPGGGGEKPPGGGGEKPPGGGGEKPPGGGGEKPPGGGGDMPPGGGSEACPADLGLLDQILCPLGIGVGGLLSGLGSAVGGRSFARISQYGLASLRADSTNMRDQLTDSLSQLGAAGVLPSGEGSPLSSFLSLIQNDQAPLTQLLLETEPLTM